MGKFTGCVRGAFQLVIAGENRVRVWVHCPRRLFCAQSLHTGRLPFRRSGGVGCTIKDVLHDEKQGHGASDRRAEEAPRAYRRHQPIEAATWVVGKNEKLSPGGAIHTTTELFAAAHTWAKDPKVNGYGTAFTCVARSAPLKYSPHLLRAELSCSACQDAPDCSWHGIIRFDPHASRLEVWYVGSHCASNRQRKRFGTLTPAQAQAWDASKAPTGIGKLGALASMEVSPCDARQSQGRLKRQRRTSRPEDPSNFDAEMWPVAAIDALLDHNEVH